MKWTSRKPNKRYAKNGSYKNEDAKVSLGWGNIADDCCRRCGEEGHSTTTHSNYGGSYCYCYIVTPGGKSAKYYVSIRCVSFQTVVPALPIKN